jgi:polyphenol oxidase
MDQVEVIRAKALSGVAHGFLGRGGGVSHGIFEGLNVGLGSSDDRDAVAENRRRAVVAVMPTAQLVTLHQVHSAIALPVTHAFADDARPHADALVTDRPGLLLGVLTADCGPILLADKKAGIVAAAHAGWKGALGGVTDAAIVEMEKLGADRNRIVAAIGPCIARTSYEVDDGFARRFEDHDPENERYFSPGREGHHQFDLEGYIVHRLANAGIGRVEALGLDTYGDPDRFFSFRRTSHKGEADYGRQISLIGLSEDGGR